MAWEYGSFYGLNGLWHEIQKRARAVIPELSGAAAGWLDEERAPGEEEEDDGKEEGEEEGGEEEVVG